MPLIHTTFMLGVCFPPSPECVVTNYWKIFSNAPSRTRTGFVLLLLLFYMFFISWSRCLNQHNRLNPHQTERSAGSKPRTCHGAESQHQLDYSLVGLPPRLWLGGQNRKTTTSETPQSKINSETRSFVGNLGQIWSSQIVQLMNT